MTPDFIEHIAMKIAVANNGGTWAEHYHETHKDVWRERAREVIADVLEEAAKIASEQYGAISDDPEDYIGKEQHSNSWDQCSVRIAMKIRERAKKCQP